jgi:ABC-type transport system involved in multi-copper enzyme maturation permease subunit
MVGILSVRVVTVRQASRGEQLPRKWWNLGTIPDWRAWTPGPSLDYQPVLWREWRRKRPSRWVLVVWLVYVLGAGLFSGMAIAQMAAAPAVPVLRFQLAIIVNAIQVAVGLLLLSVASVTCLADDRIRGTFEVLLTAPISTSTIVRAKWLSASRVVLAVAIFPIIVGFAIAWHTDEWLEFFMLTALILAYGLVITSLGLALATWVRRYGRAIASSVTIYVFVSVVFIFIPVLLFTGPDSAGQIVCASPFFGAAFLTEAITGHGVLKSKYWEGGTLWVVIYSIIAIGLYLATLATFNRSAGRMREGRFRDLLSVGDLPYEHSTPSREDWWKLPQMAISPQANTEHRPAGS